MDSNLSDFSKAPFRGFGGFALAGKAAGAFGFGLEFTLGYFLFFRKKKVTRPFFEKCFIKQEKKLEKTNPRIPSYPPI